MSFRGEPQSVEEHIGYIYELLRRLHPPFIPQPIIIEEGGDAGGMCPCPVMIRVCVPGGDAS